jgi:adenylylsulfate kinase
VSWAIWVTGPPASGKSVIAAAAVAELRRLGEPVQLLELDALRRTLTPEPTYGDAEREIVYRTLVYLARRLTGAGVPVVIDATAHRRAWRDLARASIAHFAEVQLACPLPVRRERERTRRDTHAPRGIYAAAERPGATVPGVNVPYEEALAPELRIDTAAEDVETAAARVVALALDLRDRVPTAATSPDGRRGRDHAVATPWAPDGAAWAVWITGLPGSGKSTLAWSVMEALAARGIGVQQLDLADLGEFVLGGRHPGPAEEEILHRALVCAARVLTAAGIPVLIDATAPRRAWRQMAREAIAHFAEVQLRCPAEVCGDRERAVRWNLVLHAPAPTRQRPGPAGPDIVLAYEYSTNPDLTVHTDSQSPGTSAELVLQLAEQLHRAACARRQGGSPCSSAI